ncbi:hypothetical protein [Paraburkholderia nemoris]|uniref:hypothetical protein n=1 Tax=Paraburkholderia nemoris TaxID=2793076 RepID=UPI001B25B7E0|nr:hypothetical protein [Paraburkholderia nemoris]CAE6724973.1 hypothetical protein LMG22931_01915 [Paraburkholderia nemoris]
MKFLYLITLVSFICAAKTVQAGESIGPPVMVPPVQYAVNNPTPNCEGSVTPDDVLTQMSKAPVVGSIADWANQNGYGAQKHQDYAECRPVCASIPKGIAVSEDNIYIYWNEAGPTIDLNGTPYSRAAYGRFDAGPGYHEIDPGFGVRTIGDKQVVCKIARNWATHSRLFQMKIVY